MVPAELDAVALFEAIKVPAWTAAALCRAVERPDAMFFPERGGNTRAAKALCATCPVKIQCLRQAIADEVEHGVWGGMTAAEIGALRKNRKRQVA
jgi:WhiB family redox-sensing transcriptional regulator